MIHLGFIYKLTNSVNGKIYIGQTRVSIKKRWGQHKCNAYREGVPGYDCAIYRAIRKYGVDGFIVDEVEECEDELLNEREIYWIAYYNSNSNKVGYNLTNGGCAGYKMNPESPETCARKSAAQKGENNSFYGMHHTRETVQKFSTPVVSCKDNGEIIKYYSSQIAANDDGFQQSHVTDCVKGKVKHHGRLEDGTWVAWRFADEKESEIINTYFLETGNTSMTVDEFNSYALCG